MAVRLKMLFTTAPIFAMAGVAGKANRSGCGNNVPVSTAALADAEQGRPAADHAAGRLVDNVAVGQCLLQLGDARVGDLGAVDA